MKLHEFLGMLPCDCFVLDEAGNIEISSTSVSGLLEKDKRGFMDMIHRAFTCCDSTGYIYTLRGIDYDVRAKKSAGKTFVVIQDVTSMVKRAMDEANRDPLTGLLNRRGFLSNAFIKIGERKTHDLFRVIGVDIDFFKGINDNFGHPAGDEVIRQVAAACASSVRSTDIAGRWGGEEFFLLIEADKKMSLEVGERLREAVGNLSFQFGTRKTRCTISVGISSSQKIIENLDELIDEADKALYRAKENGRNRVESFEDGE